MANELTIMKVTSVPTAPYSPSTLYLYLNATELMVYLTDATGTMIYRTVSSADIGSVVMGIINSIKGSANGLASLDSQSKVIQEALTSSKWTSPITLNLTGSVAGQVNIDGSSNVTIDTVKQLSSKHSPTFTYNSGLLSSATFSNNDQVNLNYTQGRLNQSVSTIGALNKVVTKNIIYNQDGTIASITRTVA